MGLRFSSRLQVTLHALPIYDVACQMSMESRNSDVIYYICFFIDWIIWVVYLCITWKCLNSFIVDVSYHLVEVYQLLWASRLMDTHDWCTQISGWRLVLNLLAAALIFENLPWSRKLDYSSLPFPSLIFPGAKFGDSYPYHSFHVVGYISITSSLHYVNKLLEITC